jgi:hypothetical protein
MKKDILNATINSATLHRTLQSQLKKETYQVAFTNRHYQWIQNIVE